jgi:hypothetical protein
MLLRDHFSNSAPGNCMHSMDGLRTDRHRGVMNSSLLLGALTHGCDVEVV